MTASFSQKVPGGNSYHSSDGSLASAPGHGAGGISLGHLLSGPTCFWQLQCLGSLGLGCPVSVRSKEPDPKALGLSSLQHGPAKRAPGPCVHGLLAVPQDVPDRPPCYASQRLLPLFLEGHPA